METGKTYQQGTDNRGERETERERESRLDERDK
jgi:hypothetical protein